MAVSEQVLDEVAGAILDGASVDWTLVESHADAADRALLNRLRVLATLRDLHREQSLAAEESLIDKTVRRVVPERWGPLRVLERIGAGAFGEVFRAWDTLLDREVALKLLPLHSAAGSGGADPILDEGRLLARVRHPNVVTIHGAERIDDRVGLWMELIRGRTLGQALEEGKTFSAAEVTDIGIELCRAVSAVHGAGLLHRDIKAQNVMQSEDGRIVLMDFGAGRLRDDNLATDLTGTPLYLAPEVFRGEEATVRSDVYSLGVLLYHLLTGRYPVQARSIPELRLAHTRRLDGELPPDPSVPARLAAVIARATDPHPEHRQESADTLARELRAMQEGRRANGPVIAAVAAALVVVAGLALGWLMTVRESNPLDLARGRTGDGFVASAGEPVRLAVLPFTVSGDGGADDVLQEGMARDLIARLQTYNNASVVSTASVFSASALKLPLPEIAVRLGVSAVLTGSLVQSGDTVAVDAKLLGLPGQQNLWNARYTRRTAEILDLQRAIVSDVAGALGLQRQGERPVWPTRDVDAYRLYLRGMTALDKFTPEGTRQALQFFEQALQRDPGYAQAHAGLSLVYLHMNPAIPNVSGAEAFRRGADAAARALSLDASLPDAYVASASVRSAQADWSGAERDYQRALELGPSNVLARQQFAHWLSLLGRFDESLAQARLAESLDPLSARAILAVASALRFGRRYEEAIQQALKALEVEPGHPTAYLNLGHNYQGLGRLEEAIAAFERMGRPSGNLGNAYAQAGRIGDARALVAQFEKRYTQTGLGAGEIAQIYCGLGEVDRAFEWLDRQDQFHAGWPTTFKVAPVWDPLRSDPRFQILLKKYGLAD